MLLNVATNKILFAMIIIFVATSHGYGDENVEVLVSTTATIFPIKMSH